MHACVHRNEAGVHRIFWCFMTCAPIKRTPLNRFIEAELMTGENRWRAGEHGLQEARKGLRFLQLPPVLQVKWKYNKKISTVKTYTPSMTAVCFILVQTESYTKYGASPPGVWAIKYVMWTEHAVYVSLHHGESTFQTFQILHRGMFLCICYIYSIYEVYTRHIYSKLLIL